MRRRPKAFELSPRFGTFKAPFGDQRELSAKLTEGIRTLLFRPYQRRNVADRRIRILRIRIGTLPSATPLLHNSSVAFGDSSFYTKEPLDRANVAAAQNVPRSSSSVGFADSFPSRGSLWSAQNVQLPLGGKPWSCSHSYPLLTNIMWNTVKRVFHGWGCGKAVGFPQPGVDGERCGTNGFGSFPQIVRPTTYYYEYIPFLSKKEGGKRC